MTSHSLFSSQDLYPLFNLILLSLRHVARRDVSVFSADHDLLGLPELVAVSLVGRVDVAVHLGGEDQGEVI